MQEDQQVKVTETQTEVTPTTQQVQQVTTTEVPGPSGGVVFERLVYILFGILEALLVLRFILSLLGANKGNVFADVVYGTTEPFVQPFLTLFNYQTTYGIARLELETLIAIAVYAGVAAIVLALIRLPRRRSAV